jgi:hypothetical protein
MAHSYFIQIHVCRRKGESTKSGSSKIKGTKESWRDLNNPFAATTINNNKTNMIRKVTNASLLPGSSSMSSAADRPGVQLRTCTCTCDRARATCSNDAPEIGPYWLTYRGRQRLRELVHFPTSTPHLIMQDSFTNRNYNYAITVPAVPRHSSALEHKGPRM